MSVTSPGSAAPAAADPARRWLQDIDDARLLQITRDCPDPAVRTAAARAAQAVQRLRERVYDAVAAALQDVPAPEQPARHTTADRRPRSGRAAPSGSEAPTSSQAAMFAVHPPTPRETAAVRRLCDRMARTEDEATELIDMLGVQDGPDAPIARR
ncbi:hypothetical protein [Bailinhaonella thermotolerans]|uniref:Uncharacterized protein n=1 Tax=Bailinhaonella thermotolerans TaxID=1070861 RepID=A0A3A4AHU7_9ACTN|nr:hypothetical protein [Bailinhaonella thermotolerans]RJL20184.1 hypothetical protein D5H75_39750 [Bailinhaonella thermotolerans]